MSIKYLKRSKPDVSEIALMALLSTAGIIIGLIVVLGIYWLVWQGYMLLAAYWLQGCIPSLLCSPQVLQPNYWFFSGTLLAVVWVASLLRGKPNAKT